MSIENESVTQEKTIADNRIKELRWSWCHKFYPQKYNVVYFWSYGKDDKLLQRLIAWADEAFGEERSQEKLVEGFAAYLSDDDGFISKDKHQFSQFCVNPQKWLGKKKEESKATEVHCDCAKCHGNGTLVYKDLAYRCRCPNGIAFKAFRIAPEEAFEPLTDVKICEFIAEHIPSFVRGLKTQGPMLQRLVPETFKKFSRLACGVIGKEKYIELWRSVKVIDNDIQKTTMKVGEDRAQRNQS